MLRTTGEEERLKRRGGRGGGDGEVRTRFLLAFGGRGGLLFIGRNSIGRIRKQDDEAEIFSSLMCGCGTVTITTQGGGGARVRKFKYCMLQTVQSTVLVTSDNHQSGSQAGRAFGG